jgi:hypothetical protein
MAGLNGVPLAKEFVRARRCAKRLEELRARVAGAHECLMWPERLYVKAAVG